MTTAAAQQTGAAHVRLSWTVGDSWQSDDTWAVLITGEPVDLTEGGWTVQAQARSRRDADVVLASWSSTATDPTTEGDVIIGSVDLELGDDTVTTSTVRLAHSATAATTWGPFTGLIDCEITRRDTPDGPIVENYTVFAGTAIAEPDVAR